MATVTMGTKFPAELVKEMFSKVKGKSSIAKLVGEEPIPFTGTDVFTFSLDGKISIVAEGGAKPAGGATVGTVQIRPVKVMYQWEMWGILVVIAGFFILRNVLLVVFGVDYLGDLASYWQ